MVLVRVLERKDASSLIVAIAAGLVVGQFVMSLAHSVVAWLLDVRGGELTFKADVLHPVLVLLLALALLEGLAYLAVMVRSNLVRH